MRGLFYGLRTHAVLYIVQYNHTKGERKNEQRTDNILKNRKPL